MIELPLGILNDNMPELDETLTIQLVNVSGGAMVGDNRQVIVTVLTNDDAYGAIGFAEVKLIVLLHAFLYYLHLFLNRVLYLKFFLSQSLAKAQLI